MSRVLSRVLVTGSNGLIGSQFPKLRPSSSEIFYTSRSQNRWLFDANFFQFDFNRIAEIDGFLTSVLPDAIIHTAGVTAIEHAAQYPNEARMLNVEATEEIVNWCRRHNKRLIYFSTDFVFDGTAERYSEKAKVNPISTYGKTKAQAEKLVLESDVNAVVIRTSLVYGFNKSLVRPNFPIWLVDALQSGKKLKITADQVRSPTYAPDLAQASLDLAVSKHQGVYHIAGPESINVFDFAKRVAKQFQLSDENLTPVNTTQNTDATSRPLKTALDISRAVQDINFHPHSIEEGLFKLRQEMLQP